MTSIFGVDPSSQAWKPDNNRPPVEDFAHELAKQDEDAKANLRDDAKPDPQDDETSSQDPGFESQPEAQVGKLASTFSPGESVALSSQEAELLQSVAEQLAQTTVAPTGVTEALLGARVFGWHAMVQTYLSELATADGDMPLHASPDEQSITLESAPAPSAPAPATSEPSAAAALQSDVGEPQLSQTSQVQSRFAYDDASSPGMAELAVADTTASSYWSERSLRFTRQRNGESVAWLRDFRISDTEASHLIQFVLNDAKAKGMALSKIMLNGREAWTSPNSH
jgi:hypothetical protein